MTELQQSFTWIGPSSDPNDVQIGDRVYPATMADATEADVVLVGEPYDGAVVSRSGASSGPGALRSELATMKAHRFDGQGVPEIADLGDVAIEPGSVADVHEQLETITSAVHDLDALPVFLGGDNSVSVPNVGPLVDRGSTAVINFDAHLDVREIHDEPTSGTPYRQLIERGLESYTVVGARHFETSKPYVDYVRDHGGTIYTADEAGGRGTDILDEILASVEDYDNLYVNVDTDVLDASIATGVSAPTPGGLTSRELNSLLYELGSRADLDGVEFVECAPPLDRTNRTVLAASRAIAHLLSGYWSQHE